MLEELMALAADNNNSETQNANNATSNWNAYEDLDYSTAYDDDNDNDNLTDLTTDTEVEEYNDVSNDSSDDYNDDYNNDYYDGDNYFYNNDDDNGQDNVVLFSTDSEDDENDYYYQFNDDLTWEYVPSLAGVSNNMAVESQPQQQQEFSFRDCNNNTSNTSLNDAIVDWEEAIDVIIID